MPDSFHPAVAAWFAGQFPAPTPAQARAWPLIRAQRNVLIAAPTGSGKTLAAFLAAIDALVVEGLATGLADETAVVYVSPLKALSNDVRKNLADSARGHPQRARRARAGRRRHPHAGAHRRHAAARAGEHAPPSAPRRGHDTRIAVRAARLGIRTDDARDHAHGHRRRDPRARVEQARQPPRAFAGTPRRARRSAARAHRPLGDAKADRRDRPLPCRNHDAVDANDPRIRPWPGAALRTVRDHRHRPCAAAGSRAGSPRVAARGGDVQRGVAAGIRAARRPRRPASNDARVRQHAADGGARDAAPVRVAGCGARDGAPRQPGEGAPANRRTAAEAGRAQSTRGDGIAGAWYRHR